MSRKSWKLKFQGCVGDQGRRREGKRLKSNQGTEMVPRYVRIKKLPAKHKQPHVSEGLQRESRVAAASGSRGSRLWLTDPFRVREAAKQGPRSRERPRCGKAHGSLRPWVELGQAQAQASA